jgi:hypothetical protein
MSIRPERSTMNVRRTITALALPALPIALLVGTLISPTDSTKNGPQLAAAAAHGARWQAAAAFEVLGAVFLALAAVGVAGAIRRRGVGLANAGGLLGILGSLGLMAIAVHHFFVYGLSDANRTTALHALHRLDNGVAGPIVFPLMFGGPIAVILLAGAAVRAGLVPRWTIAGAFVFFVSDMLPIPGAEIVQMVVGLATLGTIAVRLLRLRPEQAEAPASAHATARAVPAAASQA